MNGTFERIKKSRVVFPDARYNIQMTNECKDFIWKLLDKNPATRLGVENGVDDILNHPWLKHQLEPEAIFAKTVIPEFKPNLTDDMLDINNFSERMTKEELKESVVPRQMVKNVSDNQNKFKGEFDMDELIEFGAVNEKYTKSAIIGGQGGASLEEMQIPESRNLRNLTIKVNKFNKKDSQEAAVNAMAVMNPLLRKETNGPRNFVKKESKEEDEGVIEDDDSSGIS